MKVPFAVICSACVIAVASVALSAHLVTHKGTVLSLEKTTIRVNVVDPDTKTVEAKVFEIDEDTKILRNDIEVTLAVANIQKDEAISVTIDHDEVPDNFAKVIRLNAPK
ncbi:MAG: hypothetical protein HQ485_08215 [Acidobacteria bacterium]|jgi:hypothetical protein|nr:hypothetical protein [Acidobacteriota bacterium]